MKTTSIPLLAAGFLLASAPTAWAQIDFGNMLRGEVRRGAERIEGEVRGAIQDWRHGRPPYQTLPYPPPNHPPPNQTLPYPPPYQTLPYPPPNQSPARPMPSPQPRPIVRPQPWPPGVIRPVDPPICSAPPQAYPVINRQTQFQPRPQPQPQPQPEPQREVSAENLPTVFSGQEVAIDGQGFGSQPGSVRIKIGQMILIAKTTSWSDTSVDAVIPELPLVDPTEALVAVISSEKQVVHQLAIRLIPAPEKKTGDGQTSGNGGQATNPQLPVVQMGTELELAGTKLGDEPGRAELMIGEFKLDAAIVNWTDSEVTIRMPDLPLAEGQPGTIQLILADGNPVSEIQVVFAK